MPSANRLRTGDQALVREINLSLILNHLFEHPLLSRADLAGVTGLNKSTVSSLVQELLDNGLVREVGLNSNHIGRPSVLLELDNKAGYIVCCEMGVDFISVICSDFGTEIIWRHRENTHDSAGQAAIMQQTLALLHQAVKIGAEACDNCRVLGLSVGAPGLIDQTSGTLLFAPNLEWQDVPLRAILHNEFPAVPIFVENEANMALLGEYFFGAAKGYDEILFISAGVGLGGAVVLGGQLFKGKTGFASEFGHMTMDPAGLPCKCGNRGCWETQASQSAVFRYIHAQIEAGKHSLLTDLTQNNLELLTIQLVIQAARAQDPIALQALEQVGHYLGVGIASLVNAYNPDLVVFGGILSLAGEFLLPVIEAELQKRALRWHSAATRVVLAQHGSDACVIGGIALTFHHILSHPIRTV